MAAPTRLADASTLVGALAWLGLVTAGPLGAVREIIALAMLVLVPVGLRLVDTPRRDGRRTDWYRAAAFGQPLAVGPAVGSLLLPTGALATALAVPWAGVVAVVAAFGLWRLLQRGPGPLSELAIDAGLLYLAVGGAALVLDRGGVSLVFEPLVVTLTVVHFHYAGFALPVATGLADRCAPEGWPGSLLQGSTAVIALGPGIIGLGITFASLELPLAPQVEFVAVAAFTTTVALSGVAVLAGVLRRREHPLQQILLGLAWVSVSLSMGFAVCYGLARLTGGTYFGIHARAFGRMVAYHGQLNALGFAVPALLGWRLDPPARTARSPGITFSRLAAGRRVGRDFLERNGYATDEPAAGMMADVDDYAWDGFDPAAVAPSVRRFYERSGEYALSVDPDWGRPWRVLVPAYRALATRVEQLSLPLTSISPDAALTGTVVGVAGPDEHAGSRAWIRSNAHATSGDDRMTYVATYGRHVADGVPFLRVTFPLPGGNLTGLLRVERHGADGSGLRLSSHPAPGNADDAGLYLAVRGFGIRLPLDETLTVEPATADDGDGGVTAVHEVELLGRRVVTLDYDVVPALEHSD